MTEALINKILPFSSVDGPGNRTVVFLQGCNFNCLYCHNPETINRCTACGICIPVCPSGALNKFMGALQWSCSNCVSCDRCLEACRSKSSPKAVTMTVDDVLNAIIKVKSFISGITVSGGECTLQKDFLTELIEEVHKLGLTAYVDTNGSLDFSEEKKLANVIDKVMLDIKAFDEKEHIMLTGMSNSTVLKNAAYLAKLGKLYEVRTVIVPDILDNRRSVDKISSMMVQLDSTVRHKLISFRPLGVGGEMRGIAVPSEELMEELKSLAQANGCRNVIVV